MHVAHIYSKQVQGLLLTPVKSSPVLPPANIGCFELVPQKFSASFSFFNNFERYWLFQVWEKYQLSNILFLQQKQLNFHLIYTRKKEKKMTHIEN